MEKPKISRAEAERRIKEFIDDAPARMLRHGIKVGRNPHSDETEARLWDSLMEMFAEEYEIVDYEITREDLVRAFGEGAVEKMDKVIVEFFEKENGSN